MWQGRLHGAENAAISGCFGLPVGFPTKWHPQPRFDIGGIDDLDRHTMDCGENAQKFEASSVHIMMGDQRSVAPFEPCRYRAQHGGVARTGDKRSSAPSISAIMSANLWVAKTP
jgi:hypothetical protein